MRALGYTLLLLLMIVCMLYFGAQMFKGIKNPDNLTEYREQID